MQKLVTLEKDVLKSLFLACFMSTNLFKPHLPHSKQQLMSCFEYFATAHPLYNRKISIKITLQNYANEVVHMLCLQCGKDIGDITNNRICTYCATGQYDVPQNSTYVREERRRSHRGFSDEELLALEPYPKAGYKMSLISDILGKKSFGLIILAVIEDIAH